MKLIKNLLLGFYLASSNTHSFEFLDNMLRKASKPKIEVSETVDLPKKQIKSNSTILKNEFKSLQTRLDKVEEELQSKEKENDSLHSQLSKLEEETKNIQPEKIYGLQKLPNLYSLFQKHSKGFDELLNETLFNADNYKLKNKSKEFILESDVETKILDDKYFITINSNIMTSDSKPLGVVVNELQINFSKFWSKYYKVESITHDNHFEENKTVYFDIEPLLKLDIKDLVKTVKTNPKGITSNFKSTEYQTFKKANQDNYAVKLYQLAKQNDIDFSFESKIEGNHSYLLFNNTLHLTEKLFGKYQVQNDSEIKDIFINDFSDLNYVLDKFDLIYKMNN